MQESHLAAMTVGDFAAVQLSRGKYSFMNTRRFRFEAAFGERC
jgi:hypothetical protein